MNPIHYVTGDATNPQPHDPETWVFIPHVCNDVGAWGAGFVLALSAKWREPEEVYRGQFKLKQQCSLGDSHYVMVEAGRISVVNMIAQCGVGFLGSRPCIRYGALARCLGTLALEANGFEVHMPRIGSGLAGGDWEAIEALILEELCDKGISVTVYDLPRI